jgi:hypothetical protein
MAVSSRLTRVLAFSAATAFIGSVGLPATAGAATIGYFTTGGSPAAAITASGNTAVALPNLTAASLATVDVVWILNASNVDYNILGGNVAALADWVAAGGILSFHDRFVEDAASVLPGGAGISFTRLLGSDINVLDGSTTVTNGPGGVIGNTTLDGGNFSNHGYALLGTLPAGALAILSNGTANQVVDFYYSFGLGGVYYSTIPMDFYFSGAGNNPPGDQFRNIYGVNEAAFQAQQVVPEPATLLLLGSGLAVGLRRRRKSA